MALRRPEASCPGSRRAAAVGFCSPSAAKDRTRSRQSSICSRRSRTLDRRRSWSRQRRDAPLRPICHRATHACTRDAGRILSMTRPDRGGPRADLHRRCFVAACQGDRELPLADRPACSSRCPTADVRWPVSGDMWSTDSPTASDGWFSGASDKDAGTGHRSRRVPASRRRSTPVRETSPSQDRRTGR